LTNKGRIIFDKIDLCNHESYSDTRLEEITRPYFGGIEMGGVNVGQFDGTTKD